MDAKHGFLLGLVANWELLKSPRKGELLLTASIRIWLALWCMQIEMLKTYILISVLKINIITKSDSFFTIIQVEQNHANGMIKTGSFMTLVCIIWWISKSLVKRELSISVLYPEKISPTSNSRRKRFGLKWGKEGLSFMHFITFLLEAYFLLGEGERKRLRWLLKRWISSNLKEKAE